MAIRISHGDVGDIWVPQATFTVGGTPTDPTNITVKTKDAAGTIVTLGPVSGATGGSGIVRVGPGVFNTLIPITAAGYWAAQFTGTGAAAASEDHEFIADPSGFTSNYGLSTRALVGLAETKDWLQQQNVSTESDLELVRVINDVSERFHEEAEREFKVVGSNPQTRTFPVDWLGRRKPWYVDGDYMGDMNQQRMKIGDLTSFTAVTILDTDWTTLLETPALGLVTGHPINRQAWEPITELEFHSDVSSLASGRRVTVAGTWGFPSVPGTVRQAVLDAVAAIMDRDVEHYRQDSGFGSAAGQPSLGGVGTVVMLGAGRQKFLSLPPSTLAVAWSFRDPNIG